MRCSTCGSELPGGGRVCATCGSALVVVPRCPRCGYRGEGIGFFQRPSKMALLVLIGLFTYGIGALVYWLMRRSYRACPNCGRAWEANGLVEASPTEQERPLALPSVLRLPPGGGFRRFAGLFALLMAAILMSIGVGAGEPGLLVAAAGVGTAGGLSAAWGIRALRERRLALLAGLQQQTLLLAVRRGGALTATDVATELHLSLPAAERVLISMDDGYRVRSEITEEGLLIYEFPEIQHREHPRLSEGSPGS
ncbi:MAG: zinc ribbon domain-containing protein [Gemmatimonadetes bacterium]|nr:zinc ribbon domain-containing protein [Gemmatimonadota bacterium]